MLSERLNKLERRLRALFKRRELEEDLGDAARRSFGNVTQLTERSRVMWTFEVFEAFLQDMRFGARMLRKNPGSTAVAVLTVALGIGASTAVFSVINSVLLQPLPFADPDRLVRIFSDRHTPALPPVNGEDSFDWAAQNHSFEQMSLFTAPQNFKARGAGEPETVSVVNTQANFFSVIGVQPESGRGFAAGEDSTGHHHVAVLSHALLGRLRSFDSGRSRDVVHSGAARLARRPVSGVAL